jgi:long-chain fatty acid transport protein
MKKYLYVFLALVIVFLTGDLFAGSVDYLSNQSAEFFRTLNRNAVTDSADAVNYNPAGVMKMQNGLYANASGQYLMKTYTVDNDKPAYEAISPDKYKSEEPSIIPNAYLVYKQDNWAAFAAFTVPAGGGKLEFDNGTPMVRFAVNVGLGGGGAGLLGANNIDSLKMYSMYMAGTLGGAYKINDMFSISLGARYISATKSIDVDAKTPQAYTIGNKIMSIDLDAQGIGGIIGLNVNPIKDVNIGLRYETVTKLKWDTSVKSTSTWTNIIGLLGYKDGEKEKKDLPALFGFGVAYDLLPQMKISSSFNYYFIKQAKWEHYNGTKTNKYYDNGYEVGLAVEYKVIPQLLLSAGYLWADIGGNKKTYSDFEFALDSHTFSLGAKYEAISGLNISLGLGWSKYIDGTGEPALSIYQQKIKYSKDVKTIALGVEYKIL